MHTIKIKLSQYIDAESTRKKNGNIETQYFYSDLFVEVLVVFYGISILVGYMEFDKPLEILVDLAWLVKDDFLYIVLLNVLANVAS